MFAVALQLTGLRMCYVGANDQEEKPNEIHTFTNAWPHIICAVIGCLRWATDYAPLADSHAHACLTDICAHAGSTNTDPHTNPADSHIHSCSTDSYAHVGPTNTDPHTKSRYHLGGTASSFLKAVPQLVRGVWSAMTQVET